MPSSRQRGPDGQWRMGASNTRLLWDSGAVDPRPLAGGHQPMTLPGRFVHYTGEI